MPTSKDFTYTRVLFTLFRNVMNYRNLQECTCPSFTSHETHLCIILIHYTMNVFTRKQCILCHALRQKSYPTLPYFTSLRDSFCLRTFAHGFIMLPPRSLASSRGSASWQSSISTTARKLGRWLYYVRTSINFAVQNGFTCRLFLKWNAPRR